MGRTRPLHFAGNKRGMMAVRAESAVLSDDLHRKGSTLASSGDRLSTGSVV